MGTRIKLKRKIYSKVSKLIKKSPTLPIVTASLGVGTANLATNVKRGRENRELQERQIGAINNLTKSLNKVDKSLNENQPIQQTVIKRGVSYFSPFNK